jgi:hypothetical protein
MTQRGEWDTLKTHHLLCTDSQESHLFILLATVRLKYVKKFNKGIRLRDQGNPRLFFG